MAFLKVFPLMIWETDRNDSVTAEQGQQLAALQQRSSSGTEQGALERWDSVLHACHSRPPLPLQQHSAQVTFKQAKAGPESVHQVM